MNLSGSAAVSLVRRLSMCVMYVCAFYPLLQRQWTGELLLTAWLGSVQPVRSVFARAVRIPLV